MKSLKFWLMVVLLAAPVFIYSNFKIGANEPLLSTAIPTADATAVQVQVEKSGQRAGVVRVVNSYNMELANHSIGSSIEEAKIVVNVQKLPPGTYRLLVSDFRREHTRQLIIREDTNTPQSRKLTIGPLQ